jgi:DNA-directed RNA polymerase III subunit RPC1
MCCDCSGVPRLKEIINASNNISTPIIEARLVQSNSMTSARITKAQIEKTCLHEIVSYIKEVHQPNESYIAIKLDQEVVESLHINITAYDVKAAILQNLANNLRPLALRALKDKNILVNSKGRTSDDS